jgi:hypothetical protein
MYGKHSHLPTDKLVLVSSSGFTRGALKLAEFLNVDAITPGEVEPGFVGEIVNNLKSVFVQLVDFTAETAVIVFDPPLSQGDRFELPPDAWVFGVHRPDSTELCSVRQLVTQCVREIDVGREELRDADGENQFTLTSDSPLVDDEPIFLCADDGGEPAQTLRRITRFEIVGRLIVRGVEMPLKHGQFEGTNYSSGKAVGDREFHWVVTEGDEGTRIGSRVLPVEDPTSGQFYWGDGMGTKLIRE